MYTLAEKCRAMNLDPENKVDIFLARDVSERVEGLVGSIAPSIIGKGIPKRIRELEKKYSAGDWRVALIISEEVAANKFGEFESEERALETGVRVGLAYLTLGIVSAPLEGFVELRIKKRMDGGRYLSCFYAGPIRAAGGTAAAISLFIADYLSKKFGFDAYDPTEKEIDRYIGELDIYHSRIARLQYYPSDEEVKIVMKNLRIEINGDPTTKKEVLVHKYLDRVETPSIRGGMCLVLGEGLCQKAKKIKKNVDKWGKSFQMDDWKWLDELLEVKKKKYSTKKEEKEKITPNSLYIEEAVAGRPIFGHPLRKGTFRLRYGRSRLSGLAAAGMHPASMAVVNGFIATGSQLKMERPGKACIITPCDSISGPFVVLDNGDALWLDNEDEVAQYSERIKRIPFLGDILLNYGDFSNFASALAPSGYVPEWWILNLQDSLKKNKTTISKEKIGSILSNPTSHEIKFETALNLSKELKIPLHPNFTFRWNHITKEELSKFIETMKDCSYNEVLKIPKNPEIKKIMEKLTIPHKNRVDYYTVEHPNSTSLLYQLGFLPSMIWKKISNNEVLKEINKLSSLEIKDTAGTPIGTRLGRPEKAKMRKLKGSPQGLFPCGSEGGRLRNITASFDIGKVTSGFPVMHCNDCNRETIFASCEICSTETIEKRWCNNCKTKVDSDVHCRKETSYYRFREIDLKHYINTALKNLGVELPPLVKGVRATWSKKRSTEKLEKAILRSIHNIYVNKDGTVRYDMIETPITHFKPTEIGITVKRAKELGYEFDINGDKIENENQIITLFPQDIIIPDCDDWENSKSGEDLIKICNFVDDLLQKFYNKKPFYKVKSKEDLIGQLVIGLAPHTSSGIVGRIIGFSKTQGFYAHPYYHAAMRRNCDGDESSIILLMDGLLNFSRQFLPDSRGSRSMDAPLVLTTLLVPNEVDDEVHNIDRVTQYPLEFYQKTEQIAYPWDLKIEQISDVLNTEKEYESVGFTHSVSNMNLGPKVSAYKTLLTMMDKVEKQMEVAEKIDAVDTQDVSSMVIEKHFMKDIRGNMRRFGSQRFRCVKCNEKYRRIPIMGVCIVCKGKILLTVSQGTVIKYIEPSQFLANKYGTTKYLMQVFDIIKRGVESVFLKDEEEQTSLVNF